MSQGHLLTFPFKIWFQKTYDFFNWSFLGYMNMRFVVILIIDWLNLVKTLCTGKMWDMMFQHVCVIRMQDVVICFRVLLEDCLLSDNLFCGPQGCLLIEYRAIQVVFRKFGTHIICRHLKLFRPIEEKYQHMDGYLRRLKP